MNAKVEALSAPQRREFCIRLWMELTLAGRSVWNDERVDQQTQLAAMKWLNEIQHRVHGAYVRNDTEALRWLLERIASHCKACPAITGHVRIALERAFAAVASAEHRTND